MDSIREKLGLPRYFLADLPREAEITPQLIQDACENLRENRASFLQHRSTAQIVDLLDVVAEDWLNEEDPFRRAALAHAPGLLGFSRATFVQGMDAFWRLLKTDALEGLILQDLGHAKRLDEPCSNPHELAQGRGSMAHGPVLQAHFAAGNLPCPALMTLVLGLLTRSSQFMKCGTGSSLMPLLFAHSLYRREPKIGACLEVVEWPGGQSNLEKPLLELADCVSFTGGETAWEDLRQRIPHGKRVLEYGHRVSFGFLDQAELGQSDAKRWAMRAAEDVSAWDQWGCLSPHVFYVQKGGAISPMLFAEMLAEALQRKADTHPRSDLSTEEWVSLRHRRELHEVRAAHAPEATRVFGPEDIQWTVVYEEDTRFQYSCLNRFIYVKGVSDLGEALEAADGVRGRVSTVGLAASDARVREWTPLLGRWGVTRVCPIGRMQSPPLAWRHDGRPALADLVTWTDMEL